MLGRTLIALSILISGLSAQAPPAQPQDSRRDLDIVNAQPRAKVDSKSTADSSRPAIPRSYALVIGISQYKNLDAASQLHYAERDAESIYSVLISLAGGNFHAENVHKLVGPQATLANVRHELEEWLPSVSKDDDRVLIFFAGHGFILDNGNGYLAPYDFDKSKAAVTGYPMDTLGRVFGAQIKAKWKVLLTDSCHSGAITPATRPERVNEKLRALDRSVFSLTASRDREVSLESPDFAGGHGLFTYFVVQGLGGAADENGDGVVNADELAEYVRRNVREVSKAEQNPTSDRGSFDPNMLLAYDPSGVRPGEAPAPKDGTLIFESNMDGVELFVDDKPTGVLKKGEAYRVPGLQPGAHVIKAVRMGYEPDGPREEMVYPGQESTVRIRILIARHRSKAAVDAFDKGVAFYSKGFEANYRKAQELFQEALQLDPQYSAAALYLGRTCRALYDQKGADTAFRKAIEIDPDYLEARSSFAGMLLDNMDVDEAVRQLNVVILRAPDDNQALYLLAEAYRIKGAYKESIDAARKSIRGTPNNPDAHFWLAESLRLNSDYDASKTEYQEYLRLSNYDSGKAGQLNYYVAGYLFGMGKRRRATQQDIWRDLRSLAYFGLCDCDRKLKRYDTAIGFCTRSLSYDPKDANCHYALGLIYAHKSQDTGSLEALAAASMHFRSMLALNSDLAEADDARKMLTQYDALLAAKR